MITVLSSSLEFDSSDVMKKAWRDLILETQKEQKISFDLENDSSVGDIKKKEISDDIYHVQLYSAGGDWESPVYYFRIQLKEGFPSKKLFIFIPSHEEGNGNLTKSTKSNWVASDTSKDDNRDEKKAWKALEKYLKTISSDEDRFV